MEQHVSSMRRLSVAGLTMALLLAWLVTGAVPAGAFGSSEPPPLPAVNAGGYMTCGVAEDGTAVCWGADQAPADGNAAPGMATPPEDVTFQEVNAGYGTACGVTTDNTVVCWGNDRFGKVSAVPPGEYTHVVPGLNYVCALGTDSTVTCWGGDDPAAPGADPDQLVVADVPDGEFTQLTVGIRHACALAPDGTITCWGFNGDGQLNVPEGTYTHVNVGNFTSCAVRTDGTAVCWGLNQQPGFPVETVPEATFAQVSVGFNHVCGLRPDGTILCWGRNSEGQATAPAGTFTDVSTGTFHSCAMPTSGPPAVCWGNNQGGRVQPSLSNTQPPAASVDVPYSFALTMDTHVSPAPTFSVTEGSLPAGIDLSPEGLLSGTPTEAGTATFTVAASSLGLSPPDCPMGATGSLPCEPGDPESAATATRVFTIEISAADPGTIAGQVTDAGSGTPIEGATVTAAVTGGAPAGQATTDGSGNYTISDLAPGDYTVTADAGGYLTGTQDATVAPGETTTVDFSLEAEAAAEPPTVVGVWNNHFQSVTDGLYVEWSEPIAAQPANEEIGASGYTIHEEPDCTDEAIATGEEALWQPSQPAIRDLVVDGWENVTYGETYFLRVAADTELGTESNLTNDLVPCFEFVSELREQDQNTIAGQVTDADTGAPIQGATVTAFHFIGAPGVAAAATTTDGDGNYSIGDLAPGTYLVEADADGYEAQTISTLAQGGGTVTVDFSLQAEPPTTGSIAGQVTDADTGEPIAGATVTAGGESTATDDDGDYMLPDLEPGDYTVTADADDYEPDSTTATVVQGEETTVDFALASDEPEPTDPATKNDCKSGGWADYGFRNQGQCIRFVNTGMDSRP